MKQEKKKFYHLYPSTSDFYTPLHEASVDFCLECSLPTAESLAIDVHVEERNAYKDLMSGVSGKGLIVAKDEFIELFPDEIGAQIFIGKLFNPDGKNIAGISTINCHKRLVVRGTKNVSYRRCPSCNRLIYFASGRRYLCPSPEDPSGIYVTDLAGLVVNSDLFGSISSGLVAEDINIEELNVLVEPLDGLPVNLHEAKGSKQWRPNFY